MNIVNLGHGMHYEMERLALLFLGGEKTRPSWDEADAAGDYLSTRLEKEEDRWILTARLSWHGRTLEETQVTPPGPGGSERDAEIVMGRMVYRLFSQMTGKRPQWGILTGVRPVKMVMRHLEQGLTPDEISRKYQEKYLVAPEKITLALQTAQRERELLGKSAPDSYSLYLSIPFCPSRCHYCSFVSREISHPSVQKLMDPYVDCLVREIRQAGSMMARLPLRLETVYFGGGTPTTLTAGQLERLFTALAQSFPMEHLLEYTVEAGRPDTIDREKLEAMRRAGVSRISINPQSLDDGVLEAIGRRHTAAQAAESFALAREVGFDCINMDLIAGLEGDSPRTFQETVEKVLAMGPENVTVHTLSVKRAADYGQARQAILSGADHDRQTQEMVEYARQRLMEEGYGPYYLYRQKNMVANLENTGYALPGTEGLYNVLIMEELQTILALGAGGVTKLWDPASGKLERIFTFKHPNEYISRFEEVLERKKGVERFYERAGGEELPRR